MSVSVVMITYGHEKFIEEAINGVLMQECNFDVELIIANDASPDSTDLIIQKIASSNPKASWIKYIRHENNIGLISNLIFALQQSKGKYIALCEGDDYWTDVLKLQSQVDFLEKNIDYSCHYLNCIKSNNSAALFLNKETFDFDNSIKNGKLGPTLSFVFRGEILRKINLKKYFEGSLIGDWPLELLALMFGKGYRDNRICGVYRITDSGYISKIKSSYINPKLLSRYLFFKNFLQKRIYRELGFKKEMISIFFTYVQKSFKSNKDYKLKNLLKDMFLVGSRYFFD